MNENFPVINGNEFQIEGFQVVIPSKEEASERIERAMENLQRVFKGETAHKIVRLNYQRGQKSFLFNATLEQQMYNEIRNWMEEVSNREYYPLVFEFRNFVTFSPPTLA